MGFTSVDIERYCKDHSDEDTDLLKELSKTIWETEEMHQLIKNNHRLEPLLLPVRDGVIIYRKSE